MQVTTIFMILFFSLISLRLNAGPCPALDTLHDGASTNGRVYFKMQTVAYAQPGPGKTLGMMPAGSQSVAQDVKVVLKDGKKYLQATDDFDQTVFYEVGQVNLVDCGTAKHRPPAQHPPPKNSGSK